MPHYRYLAVTQDGKEEIGNAEHATEALAYASLVSLGLTVVELTPVDEKPTNHVGAVGRRVARKIPLGEQADLAEKLALMSAARLPIGDMLRILADSSDNPAIKKSLTRVSQLVADGMRFPDAFQSVAKPYSPLFPSLISVSFASANPEQILTSLSRYLRKQDAMKSEISTALIYPVILVMAAVLVMLLLAFYLAPSLAPMFTSLDQPMPMSIAFFLGLRDMLVDYWLVLPAAMVLAPLVGTWITARFPSQWKQLGTRVPVLGPISASQSLARSARALELLLSSGRPLAEALREVSEFLREETYAHVFREASDAIETGALAAAVFDRETKLPKMFRELFRYGEQTNTLPQVIVSLAASLEANAERQSQSMARLIVPVLTLVVGGGIALLVYSVMSAVLSVSDLSGV